VFVIINYDNFYFNALDTGNDAR